MKKNLYVAIMFFAVLFLIGNCWGETEIGWIDEVIKNNEKITNDGSINAAIGLINQDYPNSDVFEIAPKILNYEKSTVDVKIAVIDALLLTVKGGELKLDYLKQYEKNKKYQIRIKENYIRNKSKLISILQGLSKSEYTFLKLKAINALILLSKDKKEIVPYEDELILYVRAEKKEIWKLDGTSEHTDSDILEDRLKQGYSKEHIDYAGIRNVVEFAFEVLLEINPIKALKLLKETAKAAPYKYQNIDYYPNIKDEFIKIIERYEYNNNIKLLNDKDGGFLKNNTNNQNSYYNIHLYNPLHIYDDSDPAKHLIIGTLLLLLEQHVLSYPFYLV